MNEQLTGFLEHLRRAALRKDGAGATDAELLECYVARGYEAAFEGLLRRHGPMVLGVCRRVLRNEADAEDAFQATFLVLVRKAGSILPRSLVGNWLYGVAHSTALKAKAMNSKRRAKERAAGNRPRPETSSQVWEQLQAVLDEELSRLPDKYRVPVVLCELEGKTVKAAARQLGWPQGTVASRLSRARGLLAQRLARRGLTLAGGALGAVLAQNAASAGVPHLLLTSTIKAASLLAAGKAAATGAISVKVAALTQGVMKAMLFNKLKAVVPVVLVLCFLAIGASTLLPSRTAAGLDNEKPTAEKPVKLAAKQQKEQETFTAWSEEQPGGIQIGLGYLPGEKRVYRTGEIVTVVVRVRNVGKQKVNLEYVRDLWINYPPTIVDGDGEKYPMPKVLTNIIQITSQVSLKPGEESELYKLKLELLRAGEKDDKQVMKIYGTGKFQIQEEYGLTGKSWVGKTSSDAAWRGMTSGKLELQVTEADDKKPTTEQEKKKP